MVTDHAWESLKQGRAVRITPEPQVFLVIAVSIFPRGSLDRCSVNAGSVQEF